MGLPPSKYPQTNQKMGLRSKNGVPKWKLWVYKKWNWGWMGSGVIQMGSYFGKMTPRGSGSFLNRMFGLPRPKNIKKVLKYAWTPLGALYRVSRSLSYRAKPSSAVWPWGILKAPPAWNAGRLAWGQTALVPESADTRHQGWPPSTLHRIGVYPFTGAYPLYKSLPVS